MSTALDTLYDGAKSLGLGLVAFHVLSGAVTHFFRDRTAEDLARMKVEEPRTFKFLEFCKSAGLNSPRLWQLVLGILFAKITSMPGPQPSVTNEKEHPFEVPPVEPPSPPES